MAISYVDSRVKKEGCILRKKELIARQGRILNSRHKQAHSVVTTKAG
jgi:hypothetical protein